MNGMKGCIGAVQIINVLKAILHQNATRVIGTLARGTRNDHVLAFGNFIQTSSKIVQRNVDGTLCNGSRRSHLARITNVQNNRILVVCQFLQIVPFNFRNQTFDNVLIVYALL